MAVEKNNPPLFGTNGIRGVPNVDLNAGFSVDIGAAAATFFHAGTIAMGRDTRDSGPMIFSAVASGVMSTGTDVLDLGILPTPALQYYCKINGIPGIVITASHNPPQFNGIKCISPDGTELPRNEEESIESIFYSRKFHSAPWEKIGRVGIVSDAIDKYLSGVMSHLNTGDIQSKQFRVVADLGNGASYFSTPELLRKLNCKVVSLNAYPDGKFTSRNSEPRPENLKDLVSVMKGGKFNLGVAHDGDADRAVFIDETGNFIDGDITLSLIVQSVAVSGDKVVTPISSSDAIDEICRSKGAKLIRTRVGAPIVSRRMITERAKIGGEENGGVIFGPHQYCRDGAMTLGLILDLMATNGKKLSELVKCVPEFHIYKLSVERKTDWDIIKNGVVSYVHDGRVETEDGLKIFLKDGWVLMRPSGTEPIIRVYGESRNERRAKEMAEEYEALIRGFQEASAL